MANVIINTSSSGDTTLLAAQGAGKIIRVLEYVIVSSDDTTVYLKDGAGNRLTGDLYATNVAAGGISASGEVKAGGLFDCAPNTALILNNSAAVAIGGHCRVSILGPV